MHTIRSFAMFCLIALASMPARTQDAAQSLAESDHSSDTTELIRLATEAGHAYARRDLPALERLTADDYVQTDVRGGVLRRTQWLEFVKNRKSELTVETDGVQVTYYGPVAVVIGHWTYRINMNGKEAITNSRWTSVWTRSPEGWKRHTFQNTYVNANADRCAIAEGTNAASTETASTQSSASQGIQLTSEQAAVWKGEENLQKYEQQKDLKRFLSIWDEHFVGWPDYDQRPAYKPEFEASAAEEFKEPGTTSPPIPPPRPQAVVLFGDVAVTHYFWPEADQSSPTVFRITHTWQKGPAGWHIIGGMSCEVPRAAPAQAQSRIATSSTVQLEEDTRGGMSGEAARLAESKVTRAPAKPDDVSSLDRIIDASFDALTGPAGAPRQWDRYLSLFDPDARFVSASADAAGHATIHRWSREEYVAAADDYLVKTGFTDRKLGCVTNEFGNVANLRCGFEGLEQSKLVERGVAIYQLYNDGKRWWIQSVVWDQERPGNPIPAELLTTGRTGIRPNSSWETGLSFLGK